MGAGPPHPLNPLSSSGLASLTDNFTVFYSERSTWCEYGFEGGTTKQMTD